MSEVKYRVCDRCGKPLKRVVWKAGRPVKFRLSYRTPDPYDYGDYDYEFCSDCGEAVRNFISSKQLGEREEAE